MTTLDDAAAELYRISPVDFVNRREELTRAARTAGDRTLATQIKGLRRPTVAAWVINTMIHEHLPPLTRLLEVGAELRAAQAMLDAAELRRLTAVRQQTERETMAACTARFADLGEKLTPATVTEIENTLRAALADPAAAEAVASGRLTRALSYAGFGEVDLTSAIAVASPARDSGPAKPARAERETAPAEPVAGTAQTEPPNGDAAAAQAEVVDIASRRTSTTPSGDDTAGDGSEDPEFEDAEFEAAQRALQEAQQRLEQAAARRELAAARRTVTRAGEQVRQATRDRDEAQAQVADLAAQLEAARQRLDDAESRLTEVTAELTQAQKVVAAQEPSPT